MILEKIRKAIDNGISIEYTAHCQKRMAERGITRQDIELSINKGEIIEEYPLPQSNNSEKSLPAYLVLGTKVDNKTTIHVVIGYNEKRILIISVCYPDKEHWFSDYKTRRK